MLLNQETKSNIVGFIGKHAMIQGEARCIFSAEQVNICKDGVVELIWDYPAGNQVRCYYRYENGAGVMVDYLRYDQQKDPGNPLFRSSDASGQDISLEAITQEEFDGYRQMYQPIELDLKPLLEFPCT